MARQQWGGCLHRPHPPGWHGNSAAHPPPTLRTRTSQGGLQRRRARQHQEWQRHSRGQQWDRRTTWDSIDDDATQGGQPPPLTRHEGDRVCVGGCNTGSRSATPDPASVESRAKAAGWLADTNRTCSWPDGTREASVCVGLSSRRASHHRPRPSLLMMVCPRSTDRRWRRAPPPPSPPRRHDWDQAPRLGKREPSHTPPVSPPPPTHVRLPRAHVAGPAARADLRTTSYPPRGQKPQSRASWTRAPRCAQPSCPARGGPPPPARPCARTLRTSHDAVGWHRPRGRGRLHAAHPPARGARPCRVALRGRPRQHVGGRATPHQGGNEPRRKKQKKTPPQSPRGEPTADRPDRGRPPARRVTLRLGRGRAGPRGDESGRLGWQLPRAGGAAPCN